MADEAQPERRKRNALVQELAPKAPVTRTPRKTRFVHSHQNGSRHIEFPALRLGLRFML